MEGMKYLNGMDTSALLVRNCDYSTKYSADEEKAKAQIRF